MSWLFEWKRNIAGVWEIDGRKLIIADNEDEAWFDFFLWLSTNAEDYLLQTYRCQDIKGIRGKISANEIRKFIDSFVEFGLLTFVGMFSVKEL